jgi:UDP-N-acetylmuramate--alanine ligase
VILLDIYPARELPIEGVSSELIFRDIRSKNKRSSTKADLLDVVREMKPPLLVTIGAGDIDQMLPALKSVLKDQ